MQPPIRNYRIITPNGKEKLIQESAFKVEVDNIQYLCGISRDITEHKTLTSHIKSREYEIALKLIANGVSYSNYQQKHRPYY